MALTVDDVDEEGEEEEEEEDDFDSSFDVRRYVDTDM